MKRKLLTVLMCVVCVMQAWAYDFEASGIYYTILSETEVEVVNGDNEYTGDIAIPATVSYEDKTYGVTSIGSEAFRNCYALTSMTIPNSVMSIGEEVFFLCAALTSIDVSENNPNYSSLDGVLFDKTKETLIQYPGGKQDTEYSIPGSVTTIENEAFYFCSHLTSVTIPNGATSIGDKAFYYCTGLTSVTIPSSVTSIGEAAFVWCRLLTSVIIPDGVTNIGSSAFAGCEGLTSVTIPGSVTNIGDQAFDGCYGLTSVTISDGVINIGSYAFAYCLRLTSVSIPKSVTNIGVRAFHACSDLTAIDVNENNPNYSSLDGVLFNKVKSTLIQYPGGKQDAEYSIPGSVTTIGNDAFYYCYRLTSVTIPGGVTSIGANAFYFCYGLTSVSIPKSVTSIGDYAFAIGGGLKQVEVQWGTPLEVTDNLFGELTLSKLNLDVPAGTKTLYAAANVWKNFGTISDSPIDGLYYNITGDTEVEITSGENKYEGDIVIPKSVTIEGKVYSVTTVGYQAFYACTGLSSVSIPNSVTKIGTYAFSNCTGLTSIIIPSSITSAGMGTFAYCTGIKQVEVYWVTPLKVASRPVALFSGLTLSECTLYVPVGTKALYEEADVWKDFGTIIEKGASGIIIDEDKPVGKERQGSIDVALNIPKDTPFEGSFNITLPAGFVLNLELTSLVESLANNYSSSITALENNTWKINIAPKTLRSSEDFTYQKIMNLVYDVDDTVNDGTYGAMVKELDFQFEGGYTIVQEEISLNLTVNTITSLDVVSEQESTIYISGNTLYVNTPVAETVFIYSIEGKLLDTFNKAPREVSYPVHYSNKVLIVKTSSGEMKKVIN